MLVDTGYSVRVVDSEGHTSSMAYSLDDNLCPAPLKRRTHVVHYCKDFTPVIATTSSTQLGRDSMCRRVVYTLLALMAAQVREASACT